MGSSSHSLPVPRVRSLWCSGAGGEPDLASDDRPRWEPPPRVKAWCSPEGDTQTFPQPGASHTPRTGPEG